MSVIALFFHHRLLHPDRRLRVAMHCGYFAMKTECYSPSSVRRLFDEMASTYGVVNLICSFGFAALWRRQAIGKLPAVKPLARVADLMSGMGELWHAIGQRTDRPHEVVAIDISPEMVARSKNLKRLPVTMYVADVFACDFAVDSFDAIVSSFGLKTFNAEQQAELAAHVGKWLRPGGTFSFVEISVPPNRMLRALYMFYLHRIIPLVGWMFLGNPRCYRMLGKYTEAFGDCREFEIALKEAGLQTQYVSYFFGCATGVYGRK